MALVEHTPLPCHVEVGVVLLLASGWYIA